MSNERTEAALISPGTPWPELCAMITVQMRLVMMPFVTPLVRGEKDGAVHIGSGGYVDMAGRKLLLTNDHVFRDGLGRLTHKFYDSDEYFRFPQAFASQGLPVDL